MGMVKCECGNEFEILSNGDGICEVCQDSEDDDITKCGTCGIEIDISSFYDDMCNDCARNKGFLDEEQDE